MSDDTFPATAVDSVLDRETGHGVRLGVSEISYAQLAAAAVAHAVNPARAAVPADPTWAPIGPRNVGGRITAFAQDDSNPLVIYAGSAHGGLWVSRDAGDTWTHVGKPEHNFPIGTITIVPGDVSTVLVGTGSMTAAYVGGLGLFRVTVPANPELAVFTPLAPAPGLGSSPGDAGLAASALRYTRIRFDHDNVNRFWVASQTGLWRFEPTATPPRFVRDFPLGPNDPSGAPSLKTALPFGAVWPDYCTDLLVARDPREEEGYNENGVAGKRYLILYAGISGAGVFRGRFDRKKVELSWDSRLDVPNADLYTGGRKFTRVRLALCDDHPAVVYAVFSSNPGPDPAFAGTTQQNFPEQDHASFVFRSDDSGSSWSKRARIPRATFYTDTPPAVHDGQADYDLLLEVDPSDPNVLVCGETDVCKSEDGATTWITILDWTNYDLGDYAQHADQHIALFDRGDHRRVWVGNDGGLSLARDLRKPPQSDRYWRKRSHGIIAAQFQDVSVHPVPAFNFMCGGGLQDNGTYASMGGPTWVHVGFADGGSFAFHATLPEHMFVAQDVVTNLATVEASPFATAFAGVTNPILGDLPLADRRAFIKVNQMPVAAFAQTGPFVGLLEQDPTLPGQCLVGWTVSATDAIAYVVPPPPAPPLNNPLLYGAGAGNYPNGVPLTGLNSAGGIVSNGEDAEAIAFGPVIAGPPQRIEGWIGTSFGQVLFAPNASLATGWALAPTALPTLGGIPRLVTRISVHPSDSWIVAVGSVPVVTSIPAVGLAALSTAMTIKITTGGAVPAAQFTFQIGTGGINGPQPTAASVSLPGTLTTLFFTGGAFVQNDTWTIVPDGTSTRRAANTSAGNVAATVTTGGKVFLTFDRGTTWADVSAPTAPLPRPNPDLSALSPGPLGALEWDRTTPQPAQLFAGTLGGAYVLPAIPSSTGLTLDAKPANIPLGTTIQLQATLAMTTGGPIPCTNAADWSSSAPANLTVNATGLVSIAGGAAVGGASTITVNRGVWFDTVTITIAVAAAAAGPPAPNAFVAPNVPIAWRPFGKTLPITLINDLTFVPGTNRLRAATFGRGIWDVNLTGDTAHQLYIRQTVIEDGRTYPRAVPNVVGPPVAPLMDPRLPQTGAQTFAIDFVHAYDIRVDAAPQSFFDDVLDGVEFDEQLGVDDAVPFEDNFVYVQVSSSGVTVTDNVHIFLFARPSPIAAPHGAAPIAVPALGNVTDVYPPGDITKPVAPWVRVGEAPTSIRRVGPAQPVVARFTWTPDATFADQNVALLAICTTPNADDRLPNPAIDATSFAAFITKERRAALRIVHVAPRPPASLYIRDGVADDTRLGGYPVGGRSPDIMVVHPDISGAADVAFKDHISRRPTDTVSGTGTNIIYVRVHNRRRFETKAKVKVFAIHLDDANAPDTNTAAWTELPSAAAFADVTVPASGVGYARVELPGANDPNPGHTNKAYLLLALVKSEDDTDPLPVKDRVASVDAFWELVSKFVDSDKAAARAVPWVP